MTPALASLLAHRRDTLAAAAPATAAALASDPALSSEADRVLVASDFVARVLGRDDALLPALLAEPGRFRFSRQAHDYRQLIDDVTPMEADAAAELVFMRELRRLRNREMVRIAWRDLAGPRDGRRDTARDLRVRRRGDPCCDRVRRAPLAPRHGVPDATPDAGLVVLGMGKLGGGELNFSSDVDLVFLFPEAARPMDRARSRSRNSTRARGGSSSGCSMR